LSVTTNAVHSLLDEHLDELCKSICKKKESSHLILKSTDDVQNVAEIKKKATAGLTFTQKSPQLEPKLCRLIGLI
jgi:hypothetical protein